MKVYDVISSAGGDEESLNYAKYFLENLKLKRVIKLTPMLTMSNVVLCNSLCDT